MLCLIFLPKLASKINRNKCAFYFFDMPYNINYFIWRVGFNLLRHFEMRPLKTYASTSTSLAAKYLSASKAAIQPVPAAVTAWR